MRVKIRAFERDCEVSSGVKTRVQTESKICRRLVATILKAGHMISVCDGEEWTVKLSRNSRQIIRALFTTDSDLLGIRNAMGESLGYVELIYGNDGFDVIADYSESLESLLKPVMDYAETFDK